MSTMYARLTLAGFLLLLAAPPALLADAAVGETAPGFSLKDLDGTAHRLDQYRGKTVVLEWINPSCPVSRRHAQEKTMIVTSDRHPEVVWLAINSTNPEHGDFVPATEHTAYNRKMGIDYPVLYDPSGEVGRAYGARTTPHMYVVGPDGTLLYNGAIDDDPPGRKPKADRTVYVDRALTSVASGSEPDPAVTRPYGCSVKY